MIGIDIGNTKVHCFWGKSGTITKQRSIAADDVTVSKLRGLLGKYPGPILVCSVVPRITKIIEKLQSVYAILIVGKDVAVPVRCLYDKREVGMDRLVAAYAARTLLAGTRIIIDCGTAITVDFLSAQGHYQGGFILPGIGSTLDVFSSCAMLPKRIRIKRSRRVIPKNTVESISRGVVEGFSAMVNAFVKKYSARLRIKPEQPLIITGGDARLILPDLSFPYYYEPLLVGKGLLTLGQQIEGKCS